MLGPLDLAAALLITAAGAGKLRAPHPAVAMLRRALPAALRPLARTGVVRLAAVGEVVIGVAVVATGGRPALALLAAAYLAFLAVSVRLASGGRPTSCGCFGQTDSPVGPAHVAVNTSAAAASIAGVVRPPGPWGGVFEEEVLPGVVGLAQAALLACLAYVAITALPALSAERRRLST